MPLRSVVVWNAMIQGYGKCGQALEALELYRLMQLENFQPDVITFVGTLNACASVLSLEEGKRVHAQIIESHCESDVKVQGSLVAMYCRCGRVEDAQIVFDKMGTRNVVVWNEMILGYVKRGQGHTALKLFEQMQVEGVEQDSVTFVGVINACANVNSLEEGRHVHSQAIEGGHELNVTLGNALIDMYSKCGSVVDSLRVFNKMTTRTVVTWTALLGGYAMHGQAKEALWLFEQMCHEGVQLDGVSFVCLLSACSHAGLLEEGLQYFKAMSPVYGISPESEHYACMVDLLGRAGHLQEAEDMINKMPFVPSLDMCKSLLSACRTHGNVQVGGSILKRILALDSQDAAGYVLLSNIYGTAGNCEIGAELMN